MSVGAAPDTYRRFAVATADTAGRLEVVRVPVPRAGRGQIVIRVHRAGVAFGDILRSRAFFSRPSHYPFTPGYDVAGEVLDRDPGLPGPGIGDRVVAYTKTGGYAEVVTVAAHRVMPIPPLVDYDRAVAVVLNYVSAHQMLHRLAAVRAGHRVLVHGGAGGVGSALLDLGRLHGLAVFSTVSAAKRGVVEGLGASPIDYRAHDFVEVLNRMAPEGLDTVFEGVSIRNAYRSRAVLKRGGTLVFYGFVGMAQDPRYRGRPIRLALDLARLRLPGGRCRTLIYAISADARRAWFRDDLGAVLRLLAEGRIHPLIHAVLPLEKAGETHEMLLSGQVAGKILLDCTGGP